jgi:predicted DNA-binding transcriptional regulator AlpA
MTTPNPTTNLDPEDLNDCLLKEQTLADLWGLSVRTLQAWRQRGEGPPYVKLGGSVRYTQSGSRRWLAKQQQR